MAEQFPEFIDPLALSEKRRQFKGAMPLSKMTRLQDILMDSGGEVDFELRFERNGRMSTVTGSVQAQLELQCQCCLGSIPWPVSSKVSLCIVGSIDEADLVSESYEPLVMEEGVISLVDIIQDELLLAVPCIPQHERCETASPMHKEKEPEILKRPNPFSVLAELKY